MERRRLIASSLVGTLVTLGSLVVLPDSAGAGRGKAAPAKASATLAISSGCALSSAVSWKQLPPISQVDFWFYKDGQVIFFGKDTGARRGAHEKSPQTGIPPWAKVGSAARPHTFYEVFKLIHGKSLVATATTPTVTALC